MDPCPEENASLYKCSPNQSEILSQICWRDQDSGCLEWRDAAIVVCNLTDGQWCKEDGATACTGMWAKLVATITVTSHYTQGDRDYYNYTLVIEENTALGVNITRGRECFQSVGCKEWATFSPPRRIPAWGQYTRSSFWYTPYSLDGYWLEYEGLDDLGPNLSLLISVQW